MPECNLSPATRSITKQNGTSTTELYGLTSGTCEERVPLSIVGKAIKAEARGTAGQTVREFEVERVDEPLGQFRVLFDLSTDLPVGTLRYIVDLDNETIEASTLTIVKGVT